MIISGAKKYWNGIQKFTVPVHLWILWLNVITIIGSLFYLNHIEAWVVLVSSLLGLLLMFIITELKGFTRLLGAGHVFWILMLIFIVQRIDEIDFSSSFGVWIFLVFVSTAICVGIDIKDVIWYVRGEKYLLFRDKEYDY